jgi:DNA-binding response OmpR family regulator
VVEDDQLSREILLDVVQEIVGARGIGAADGEAALQHARDLHPDLVLLDLRLPKLDGWQVLRELKGNPRTAEIPVLVITTATLRHERERVYEAGADDYLAKPFDLADLEAKVCRYVHGDA